MKTAGRMEEDLDRALAAALMEDALFASWFLDQTPFAGLNSRCVEVRADKPLESRETPGGKRSGRSVAGSSDLQPQHGGTTSTSRRKRSAATSPTAIVPRASV